MRTDNNRIFLIALAVLVGGFLLFMILPGSGCSKKKDAQTTANKDKMSPAMRTYFERIENPPTPDKAMEILRLGNQRYVQMKSNYALGNNIERRSFLKDGQWPYAIILTSCDSRIIPEYLFDAGLGDLVVIRVAGPVLGTSVFSAIENVLLEGRCHLLVIMGHEDNIAIKQAIKAVEHPGSSESFWIDSVGHKIIPSVLNAKKNRSENSRMEEAVSRLNIEAVMAELKAGSKLIQRHVDSNKLKLIGAYAKIHSGKVEFLPQK